MSLLSSSDATFFGFEDHTMDISEFFAGSDDLLSEGFGVEAHSLMPSPPEIRRSGGGGGRAASSASSSTTSLFYPQPLVGDEESGPEGEDHQTSSTSTSSSQGTNETSGNNDEGWTKEDTLRLTDLVKFYGHNWQEIAKSFEGKNHSPEDCQQQYQILIDYVTKQNQLQLLETADESDPSGSPSPACEFLFSSPGDNSIDPFIMQALDDNEVVMEMGNLGDYTVSGLNHHHHHSHHHLHHHSHLSRPHQHVDMASVNSLSAPSLLEMNPLSALGGCITMESYAPPDGLRQQPVRRFTMVPSASMSVIRPPTKSRKSSSGTKAASKNSKKTDKAKKKALRRAEKEKRKEQRRRKREKKQKLKEKKRADKEGQQPPLGEAVVEKKEPGVGKKRERDESHNQLPAKESHKQPRLEPSSKSGTKTKESKGTPKKSKTSTAVKPEPVDTTEGLDAFICAGPAPTSAFLASPTPSSTSGFTPAPTPTSAITSASIPSNANAAAAAAAKMAASLGPSMLSLASAVQFQQRTNNGQPVLTQQRMLYPMIMPRLQPPSVLPPAVPGLLPPPVSASAAAAAVVAATASMCGVILSNPPATRGTTSPTTSSTTPPASLSGPSGSGVATAPNTSPRGLSHTSSVAARAAATAGEQLLAPSTTAPVSVGAPSSAADGTASGAPVAGSSPTPAIAPGRASPTTIPYPTCAMLPHTPTASVPTTSATVPASPASASASTLADAATIKRKQPEDTEPQEEADKIAAAVAACLTGPAKKRKRRTAAEIERKYKCEMPNCTKSYGSEGALKMHVKLKHPGVKQPALKTPTGGPPRISPPSSLPLLLQFPLPFMPGLMGGSQPIFPAPSPAALAAANSALVSAINASAASVPSPVQRPPAQVTSPPTPSPTTATAASTAPAAASTPTPPSLPAPSATPSASSSLLPSSASSSSTSSSVMTSPSFSSPSPSPSPSPSASMPRVSATSLIPKLSAFLATTPPPASAFSSFSVHGAPMTSPFARSTPAASASSLSTPPIRSTAATTTPATAAPQPASDSVLVVPSLVLPTVLSDLNVPSSSSSAAPSPFDAAAALPTATGQCGDDQQLVLLPCKLEVVEPGVEEALALSAVALTEASDSCGGFDPAYSSPMLASDDISSSTSPSSPSGSPSPMSPPVSAADLLMDTLGEGMLSLPPAMLMDEESALDMCDASAAADLHSVDTRIDAPVGNNAQTTAAAAAAKATTARDSEATAIASEDLHTVLSISEANLGDVLGAVVANNNNGGASSASIGSGDSAQAPFDLPSSFFNPLSFAGDALEHMRPPAELEAAATASLPGSSSSGRAAPAPEPQPNQPSLTSLTVAPSDDDDARLQRALDGQGQDRHGEDLLDESPFHTGAFLVNGCGDGVSASPLSFSQHTIDSL